MARYTLMNKKTGDFVCRIIGSEEDWDIHDNESLKKTIHSCEAIGMYMSDFLKACSEKCLIKDDGINLNSGDDADTAAQPNAPDPNSAPPISSEDVSKRVQPALDIIKEVLKRAEQKRQERAELKAHQEAMELERQNAQLIQPNDGQYYVTMDGDGIGNQVARAQYTNDELKVKEVSSRIDSGKEAFIQWALSYGGTVIEAGGDEGQVRVPAAALEHIEEFRNSYLKEVGATVTVGVGRTISESIQSRELGKLRGKNQVVYFDENTEKELQLRVEQKGDDTPARKLAESGVIDQAAPQKKLGEEAPAPARTPKFGLPKGMFEENQKKQQEYEQWLDSQKKEVAS